MGYSPGEFWDLRSGDEIHWELTGGKITLWNKDESCLLARLAIEDAIKARDQLDLLIVLTSK